MATILKSPFDFIKSAKNFSLLSKYFSKASINKVAVNSALITFHTTITVFIIGSGCIFLTYNNYFGDPIQCSARVHNPGDLPPSFVEQYCWMDGIFTVYPKDEYVIMSRKIDALFRLRGIGPPSPNDTVVFHKYYQWVYFVLIIQCILFYIPYYIWKSVTNRTQIVQLITAIHSIGLRKKLHPFPPTQPLSQHQQPLEQQLNYWSSQENTNHEIDQKKINHDQDALERQFLDVTYLGSHLFAWFIITDFLCLLHLFLQILFTDIFLRGYFILLGYRWYRHAYDNLLYDPLHEIFPRMAKCSVHNFGYSGEKNLFDYLCFLPLNTVNEKIYVILWLWFFVLFFISLTIIFFRFMILFPCVRYYLLCNAAPSAKRKTVYAISRNTGQWFAAYIISCNVQPSESSYLIEVAVEAICEVKRNERLLVNSNKIK